MKDRKSFLIQSVLILIMLTLVALLPSCASRKKAAAAIAGSAGTAPLPPPPPEKQQPFVVVEEMPMFPGGDSALLTYIVKNTVYPEEAKKAGIGGQVIARFCVTSTGSVNQVSVLRGVSPALDKEAMRVVSGLPAFKPGMQGGKPVDVWYKVPIEFKLN